MSTWAQRVHRRAADLGSVVTSCGHPGPGPYPYRLEKVKFGVQLNEVCKNDIPGPLLVLILKLNKEAPQRKDVFRAPGNQSAMKKLIHFLQAGRLVNVDNFSVYTIASVLKKFLRKIPNGIFGRNGEDELFAIVDIDNEIEQQERIHRLITSLPIYTQRLLVLLFGTFRVIASNAERAGTGMTSEALGVSVAPSFFQSCVSDGKTARMEDVLRYKVATRIMKKLIDQFATFNLFGRDNYEFYARVTGRILKVEDEWICSFRFPPPPRGELAQQNYALQLSLEAGKTWLQCECERWGLIAQEESQSTPALLTSSSSAIGNSALSIGIIPELSLLESCARLSVSLEGPGVFAINSTTTNNNGESSTATTTSQQNNIELSSSQSKIAAAIAAAAAAAASVTIDSTSVGCCDATTCDKRSSFSATTLLQGSTGLLQSTNSNGMKHSSSCSSTRSSKSASAAGSGNSHHHMTMEELRAVNRYAESTKSLSYLPQFNIDTTKSSSTTTTTTIQSHVTSSHKHQSQLSSHHHQNSHHHKFTPLSLLPSSSTLSSLSSSSSSLLLLTPLVVNNFNAGRQPDNIEIKNSCCVIIDPIEKVHERQTQRMKTRSEWFLESGAGVGCSSLELSQYNTEFFGGSHNDIQEHHRNQLSNTNTMFLMLHQAQQQQHQNHLHPHHFSSWQHQQQQQQHHIGYLQRMDISADEQDSINNTTANNQHHDHITTNQQQQQQPSSMMFLMDKNFLPMSVGNIGLSASAESVQYPVKRPSRRGPNYTRHHPHRSSSHRNKENGKSLIGNTTNGGGNGGANGSGTGSGGGPGGKVCTTTSDIQVVVRSNSFRQKKSNRECCYSDNCSSNNGTKLLRKSRAVSFEPTKSNLLLPHPKVSLTPASQICSGNNDGRGSIHENCETIILMDTTEELLSSASSSNLLQSIILDSQLLTNSNSSINNLNTNSIQIKQQQQQQINNAGILISSNTSIDKLSTTLITSSPSLIFKPPRV